MFTSKDLKKLIIPLIFEQLLAVSVGFVDTFMVSIAGEAAVSGVALVDNISNLLIQILSALATPISNTNINKAFPQILIMFMIRLVFILILLFPILLKSAAPAL